MDTTELVALEDIYRDLKRRKCRLILSGFAAISETVTGADRTARRDWIVKYS